MTYGYWITRARVHLGDAADKPAGAGPDSIADVLAVMSSRAAVYRQLARLAEMLIPPTHPNRPAQERELSGASRLATFRHRLRSAADDAATPGLMVSTSLAVHSLTAAADCLGVAGDILASHLEPRPRTPEGVAIRAGGGVVSAAVELARVVFDAIAVDLAVTEWLDLANDALRAIGVPLATAVRRTTTGTMPHVLGEVLSLAPTGPPPLHDLTAVPALDAADEHVSTAADAAARLQAARTWLWQHPDRLHAVHLRLGSQLGLAAGLLAGIDESDRLAAGWWRRAAGFASDIEGIPPTGDALTAADRLSDVLTWTRSALDHREQPRIDRITMQLASLAETLLAGAISAVERGDVFVNRTGLKRHRNGIRRVESLWHRATSTAPEIVGLRDALEAIHRDHERPERSAARSAFPAKAQARLSYAATSACTRSRSKVQPRPDPVICCPATGPATHHGGAV
jgi:hypothetical protein